MNPTIRLSVLTLALGAMVACERKAAPTEVRESHQAEGTHDGEGVHLSLKDIRGLRFLVVSEPRAEGAWYPAEAIGDESAQAILSSPVKGIVSAIQVPPGQHVGAGAGLFTLQSPELARLKADWLSARAKRDRTEGEWAREQRLYEAQAGSRRELEAAKSEAATARADEEAARLALEARGLNPEMAGAVMTVKAPRAGSVTAYKIQLGQGVEAGQELGRFQSAFAAIVQLELPLPAPENWQPGTVTEARKGDGQRWKARLEGTPMILTTDTRRLSYRLRLLGGPLPIPGTPLEIHVPLAKTVVLPQSALQQVEGTWGVFVKEGEEAEFRPVRRGPELGTDVMVLDGVKPGETVVGEGAYLLKSLQIKRKSGGDDHDH
ncbi:MexH family multidrug efflux RND transporter periplasmic adaptor subunit [Geothrix oryzae]|uniref:MexH family multidrug efflux RND transporter periplasmic adaptor subunit n=1 Tax=Geothrix oryzae TaxID=2927975 RepID=A0ABM8DTC8_9BACT|nr:efflux RND transporter periplasmic adaptor subunit [Geothrix oryzae]BDU70295.1 MexH family multidrug efflux RND transporter periplasmic adaptor subunit [Geothrix oryzae]